MKTVLLRAPVLTQSGYGVHARSVARWLLSREKQFGFRLFVQPMNWGNTPWIIDSTKENGMIGELMARTSQWNERFDTTFQLQLPNEWDPKLGKFNVGMTAAVETDRCNPAWMHACNSMSAVVVPSEHVKTTLLSAGRAEVPFYVVGEPFPECFKQNKETKEIVDTQTPFNFLVFGQITGSNPENDRKNIFYTIKWLCEAFKDNKDVSIVVKTNHGRNTKIDRNIVNTMFRQLLGEVRKGQFPAVHVVHGDMSDEEVLSLLKQASAMVSLTRGEGFGLPLLEAAAAGVPIIATNWSAHTEFLGLGKWIQIESKLVPIHDSRVDNQIFIKGTRWAEPSEESFKKRVRKFYESPTIPAEWAKQLREAVLLRYDQHEISAQYDKLFEQVLK